MFATPLIVSLVEPSIASLQLYNVEEGSDLRLVNHGFLEMVLCVEYGIGFRHSIYPAMPTPSVVEN